MLGSFNLKKLGVSALIAVAISTPLAACSSSSSSADEVGSKAWALNLVGNDPTTSPVIRDTINAGINPCEHLVRALGEPQMVDVIDQADVEKATKLDTVFCLKKSLDHDGVQHSDADVKYVIQTQLQAAMTVLAEWCGGANMDDATAGYINTTAFWGYPRAKSVRCTNGLVKD